MKFQKVTLMSILILCFHANLVSKDFGVKGQTFPIIEKDIRVLLKEVIDRSASRRGQSFETATISQLTSKPANLQSTTTLKEAEKYRCFFFDPTIKLKEDIKDLDGTLIARKGDQINPLRNSTVGTGLLFFDGDKEKHISWAKKQEGAYKWILVKGDPLALETRESRPIYFDQNGTISKKFHLKYIPCRINQKGDKLIIEEEPTA